MNRIKLNSLNRLVILLFLITVFLSLNEFAFSSVICRYGLPSVYIRNYDKDEYKAACQNWDVAVSEDGVLCLANSSGLLTYDGNNWKTNPLPNGAEVLGVSCLRDTIYTQSDSSIGYWLRDAYGTLYYSCIEELPPHISFSTSPDTFAFPVAPAILAAHPSAYLLVDGLHYIGTLLNGLYICDDKGEIIYHFTEQYLLLDNMIHGMSYGNNQIYVAYDNGLSIIDLYPPIRNLGSRTWLGKLRDAILENGVLYITTDRGCYKKNVGSTERFKRVENNDRINQKDNKTDSVKIEYINKEILPEPFQNYEGVYPVTNTLAWLTCGNEAGLFTLGEDVSSLHCRLLLDNYQLNMVSRDPQIFPLNDSLHLFSTTQGIALVDTQELIRRGTSYIVPEINHIEYATKDSVFFLEKNSTTISLPYDFHKLTIFIGSSVFSRNNQISYKLDEVSREWSPWQPDGKISFLQLPEGQYTLRIRKYVPTGDFPEITISLKVTPPWYNTSAAYIIYVISIWLFVHFVMRYNAESKRKENLRLDELRRQEESHQREQIKNELLEMELQNKANELMLQTSLLVRKSRLINDWIKELESQKKILGERYPNKLYNRLRGMMEESLNDQGDWMTFEVYFNNAHRNFIERLQNSYKDITYGDIRLCCLLRMNLSTKEIASILNVSIRAIELRRYRLRKRMNLDGDTNLVDYLMAF